MNKIIMLIRIINNIVLPSERGIAVIWIRISFKSRVTKKDEIHKTNISGETPPSNHSF